MIVLLSCMFAFESHSQGRFKELSHYMLPEFVMGTVLLKTGVDYEVMLNYNSLTEEMIFISDGKKLALDNKTLEKIDTVFIQEQKFIGHNNIFLELLFTSDYALFAEHKCRIKYPGRPVGYGGTSQTAAVTSYSQIQADGLLYELSLPDDYEVNPYTYYWLKKDGEMHQVLNIRQLRRLFSDKRDVYNAYVRENRVQFDNPESITQLVKHMSMH